jgi:hypothetical protein
MKTIILSFFLFFISTILNAQQCAIAQPEYGILYRGYPNKIVPLISSEENAVMNVSVSSGTCTPATWTDPDDGIVYKGYTVVPLGNQVTITLSGKNKNGTLKNYGSFKYQVKSLPSVQLENFTISKATSTELSVGLGEGCPLDFSYEIKGGRVFIGDGEFSFTGNIVPPSILEKTIIGMNISISVDYIRLGSESEGNTKSVLKVVE